MRPGCRYALLAVVLLILIGGGVFLVGAWLSGQTGDTPVIPAGS